MLLLRKYTYYPQNEVSNALYKNTWYFYYKYYIFLYSHMIRLDAISPDFLFLN